MTKKKILILGGSGYLGQNIARRFETDDKYVVSLGDLTDNPKTSNSTFIKVDVFEKLLLDTVFQNHDLIINCTGQITSPINTCLKLNTEGIANIVDAACKHKKKIFHISTVGVYGSNLFVDEQSELNPDSPYSTCKAFAEFQVTHNNIIKHCILRLPNLYGENQTKGVFAYFRKSFLTDRKIYINNNGNMLRYFLHITDCAEAIFLAIEKDLSGIFNVTAPDKYTIKELIEIVETLKSMKFDTIYDQYTSIENNKTISFNSFSEKSGFIPKHDIHSFIKNSFRP